MGIPAGTASTKGNPDLVSILFPERKDIFEILNGDSFFFLFCLPATF